MIKEYCNALQASVNRYQTLTFPAAQKNTRLKKQYDMIDLYTRLPLISYRDYLKKNDEPGEQDNLVDSLIRKIDRRIYEIELQSLEEKSYEFSLSKIDTLKITIHSIEKEEGKQDFYFISYIEKNADNKDVSNLKTIKVKASAEVMSDFVKGEDCVINGTRVFNRISEEEYTLICPYEEKIADMHYDGHVILSPPGGGKTTFLKILILRYLLENHFLCNLLTEKLELPQKITKIPMEMEQSFMEDIKNEAIPIMVKIRSLNDAMHDKDEEIDADTSFKDYLVWSIASIMGLNSDEIKSSRNKIEKMVEDHGIVLFLDGIDELTNMDEQRKVLNGLSKFLEEKREKGQKRTVYITSRLGNYTLQEVSNSLQFYVGINVKEWIIEDFSSAFGLITEFTKNWYSNIYYDDVVKARSYEKSFLIPLKNNQRILSLISTPLDLTNMLIIANNRGILPNKASDIYSESIELALSLSERQGFEPLDMEMQLSYLAYYMASSERERMSATRDTIVNCILKARRDLREYFFFDYSDSLNADIDEQNQLIIRYIQHIENNTGLLVSESNGRSYSFHHLQYQAFFVSNAIINNLFARKERKRNRLDYFVDRFESIDDFWEQIIILIAMQDIDLRDEIISRLLIISKNKPNDNRPVSMIIELFGISGIHPGEDDRNACFDRLCENQDRWALFVNRRDNIQKMIDNFWANDNEQFLIFLNSYRETLEETERQLYIENVRGIVFYILLEGKIGKNRNLIKNTLKIWFEKRINTTMIMYMQNTVVKNQKPPILFDIVEEMLESSAEDDFFFIAAIARAVTNNKNYFELAAEYLKADNQNNQIIGVHLLSVISWLIYIRRKYLLREELFEYDEKKIEALRKPIQKGCVGTIQQKMYLETISDLYRAKLIGKDTPGWYSYEMYETGINKLLEYNDENRNKSNYLRYYMASFPISFAKNNEKSNDIEIDISGLFEQKFGVQYIGDRIIDFKMQCVFGLLDLDQMQKKYEELLKELKSEEAKQLLQKKDMFSLWEQIKEEVKEEVKKEIPDKDSVHSDSVMENTSRDNLQKNAMDVSLCGAKAMEFYNKGDFKGAKDMYIILWSSLLARNNLAYMLRRKEIESVERDGIKYTVEELLEQGVQAKNAFSIVNLALYRLMEKPRTNKNYQEFVNYLYIQFQGNVSTRAIYDWWYMLLLNGEEEGGAVIGALEKLGNKFVTSEAILLLNKIRKRYPYMK